MRLRGKRLSGVVATVATLLLVLPVGASAQVQDEGDGEDSSLSGYRLRGEGTPLGVLIYEPFFPTPVDPGEPHLEFQSAYTRATFNTGPSGRGLASAMWPGATLGDSFGLITGGTDYPLQASARVPEGPEEDSMEVAPGTGMHATAGETGVTARSSTSDLPSEMLGVGTYESHSESLLEDGEAVTRTRAMVENVVVAEGLIEIDGIVTELEARGDGEVASTSGGTSVTGLRIAGQGFVLDEDGLRPVSGDEDESGDDEEDSGGENGSGDESGDEEGGDESPLPLPGAGDEGDDGGDDGDDGEGDSESPLPVTPASADSPEVLREQLGIEVEMLPHQEEVDGSQATRSAGGVRITLDMDTLRALFLDDVTGPLEEAMPDDVRYPKPITDNSPVNPIDVLFLEPTVEIILARGVVDANTVGSPDFDFDLGFGTDDGGFGQGAQDGGGSSPSVADGPGLAENSGDAPAASSGQSGAPGVGDGPVEEPEVSETPSGNDAGQVQAMESASLPDSAGGNMLATVLGLAVAGLAARGLHQMTGSVFGGSGGGPDGEPTGMPNLKEGA